MPDLDRINNNVSVLFQKMIGFMQESGIVLMALFVLTGMLLFLVSGKNPIVKRAGLMMSIIFGIFIFICAYMPVLYFYYTEVGQASADTQMEEIIVSTHNWLFSLFNVLLIVGTPIVGTVMLLGLIVRGLGANHPMVKRKGVGMILISPIILLMLYMIPNILQFL